jgi:hypothetical protein
MTLYEGVETGKSWSIYLSTSLAKGDYQAVVVGLMEHYQLTATAARAERGAALLMLATWNPLMEGWENVAYGTIGDVESVTASWPTCVHQIGSR